ncbi:asparagine synthase (glutamine-hydrolyzing) [Candidatus Thiodiazotropha sp. CDECU1]|uniref:asparagine synthase (glutamine-hydrolyzing) n=1 Tax=Candidatus Thiodiazotropha sp. CDECU1 TaxID=3065865 RepID=UPI00292FEDA8|nr:asparagine synthase (glutamine-hydrolyzing) [Candidatus Thiodiazotropha sp. CDECU1]
MCGIAGVLYADSSKSVDKSKLQAMTDIFSYRGPDDSGQYVSGSLGIAHRRLSIIGLSTGHQPMTDSSNKYWIVFNGEIYNYLELKKDLVKKGYSFNTESDTEVIIYLYIEYGFDCLKYLNGMFAFAIYNEIDKSLFLARDRMGIKPIYYSHIESGFYFASEIKAILEYGDIRGELNTQSIYEYFMFRGVAGPNTMFSQIHSLLPGHYMVVKNNQVNIVKYWNLQAIKQDKSLDKVSAMEGIESLLKDAINIRLMSEVPLGTFCSGGIDSSLVTAIAAGIAGNNMNTFSVGFNEENYDESRYAKIVSDKYGTKHHELVLNSDDFAGLLNRSITLNDEPLHFSNSVHILALSELAKEHVTVVLTGEGADELFLGYPRYFIPELINKFRRLSWVMSPILRLLSKVISDHRFTKLSDYSSFDKELLLMLNSAVNKYDSVEKIALNDQSINLDYRKHVSSSMMNYEKTMDMVSIQDQLTYLVSILNRQDKMSMGASVEARVPFIDYRLVEFANSIPSSVKIEKTNTKMLIKNIAEKYLPKELIYRRKSGFGVPLSDWIRDGSGFGKMVKEVLYDTKNDENIDLAYVRNRYKDHMSGKSDMSEIIWTTVNYLLWRNIYSI